MKSVEIWSVSGPCFGDNKPNCWYQRCTGYTEPKGSFPKLTSCNTVLLAISVNLVLVCFSCRTRERQSIPG